MKYLFFLLAHFLVVKTVAQEAILIELKNESMSSFNFPIKIGQVTSEVNNDDIGNIYIPELKKSYPIKFKDSIAESISNYFDFIQFNERYRDTIQLNIKKLKINEVIKGDLEEAQLDLGIEFYKIVNNKKSVLATFNDKITISDANVSVFHEYNVRKGLYKSLEWFSKEMAFSLLKVNLENEKPQNKVKFIKSTYNPNVFEVNDTLIYNFSKIETKALMLNDPKLNRLMNRRGIKNFIGNVLTGGGVLVGFAGYLDCRYGEEVRGSKLIAGGLAGLIIGGLILTSGEEKYKSKFIQRYNKVLVEKKTVDFTPYNPIQIGFSIPLK